MYFQFSLGPRPTVGRGTVATVMSQKRDGYRWRRIGLFGETRWTSFEWYNDDNVILIVFILFLNSEDIIYTFPNSRSGSLRYCKMGAKSLGLPSISYKKEIFQNYYLYRKLRRRKDAINKRLLHDRFRESDDQRANFISRKNGHKIGVVVLTTRNVKISLIPLHRLVVYSWGSEFPNKLQNKHSSNPTADATLYPLVLLRKLNCVRVEPFHNEFQYFNYHYRCFLFDHICKKPNYFSPEGTR